MARTVIDIEEKVLEEARKLTGISKKVEIVNYALNRLVQQKNIEKLLSLKGKVKWEGDLNEMRKGRFGTR